jgi:two-component system sensor histidine kinase UhpB
LRFARPSSIRTALLTAAVLLAAAAVALAVFSSLEPLALAALVTALAAAAALALYLISAERSRHERVEDQLAAQATFLESLVESMGAIAATLDPGQVLEQARREAEQLFGARGRLLPPGDDAPETNGRTASLPLRARSREIATLRLERDRPFDRGDLVRAAVLADFAARAADNAQLLAEAETREAERERLSEQLITAEQDERRRLANELHDGAVQSMSGIALMLDAATGAIEAGRLDEARRVLESALERHRDTIRSLRDLSFSLEPVVLRDQGFVTAVKALAEQVGLASKIQIDVDVAAGEALADKAQLALYQIIREALNQALRRGPPTRMSIVVRPREDGGYEATVADDAPGERRRASFDAIAERVRTLHGRLAVEQGADGGTTVQVLLPPYAARS